MNPKLKEKRTIIRGSDECKREVGFFFQVNLFAFCSYFTPLHRKDIRKKAAAI
jgi:hypothetical protein